MNSGEMNKTVPAALCLRHLAFRIIESLPKAFSTYSFLDILAQFHNDASMPERMRKLFGIRGAVAAIALIRYGINKLRSYSITEVSADIEETKAILYPIWAIAGWHEQEMIAALIIVGSDERSREGEHKRGT